jgi:hypothetical protein
MILKFCYFYYEAYKKKSSAFTKARKCRRIMGGIKDDTE